MSWSHRFFAKIWMFPIWGCINTYKYIFLGMNIHLPAILGFTRGTRVLTHTHIFSKCFWLFSSSFSMTPGEKGGRRLHHGPRGQHAAAAVNVNSDVVVGVGLRLGAGGDG